MSHFFKFGLIIGSVAVARSFSGVREKTVKGTALALNTSRYNYIKWE